jgi:predicted peptidase
MKYPKEFVAIVPICGFGDPSRASEIAHLPTWVWHGGADKTVPVDGSRKMVEALKAAGAKEVKYTEVPGVGHNSWDNAYASDELWAWFLAHRRPAKS